MVDKYVNLTMKVNTLNLMNNNNGRQICQLNYEGKHIKSNEGMANAFNDLFLLRLVLYLTTRSPGNQWTQKCILKTRYLILF